MYMEGKEDFFREIQVGDRSVFECTICGRHLGRKQRILTHLRHVHSKSPLKRVYRKYLDDPSVPVPWRTALRLQKHSTASVRLVHQASSSSSDNDSDGPATHSGLAENQTTDDSLHMDYSDIDDEGSVSDKSSSAGSDDGKSRGARSLKSNDETDFSSLDTLDYESDCYTFTDSNSSESNEHMNSSWSSDSSENNSLDCEIDNHGLPEEEFQALSLASCFLRNKFSFSTSRDVINTFKSTFQNCEELSGLDFVKIMSSVESDSIKEFHYCILCKAIFPSNEDEFRCGTPNCDGLRYKGSLSNQNTKGRQPKQCFAFTDIKKQLVDLLKAPGIWEDIQKNRDAAYERNSEQATVLTDITDGASYREMMVDGGFLERANHNITAVFNTDGVNLYSSSKIELWPIFLAINELSPALRFSRNNILLLGLWQGKGKPPFQQFLQIFTDEMNSVYKEGVDVQMNNNIYNVKLSVLCSITDLPAKAEVLKMSYYNGEYACITCEDPGMTVKQGKGHAKCYPYRDLGSRYPGRNEEGVFINMNTGSDKNRSKGFKGHSQLHRLENFNIVDGTVPDYMHGVLLGITKTLLSKWFSPSESRKNHFIGKHIKSISNRMNNIKPPNNIERLPRDLEKHYLHFKATELQSWLLYYSIPCLKGFLPEEYMENLVCFSEAIYILLGDQITRVDLEKAVDLLQQFYASFQRLYSDGSCGLNVHNAANHLPEYVKMWGPIWCWSCFPFEDANAMLLQSVHGTGNVLKQIFKYRQASLNIRNKGMILKKAANWTITIKARNCDVAGVPKKLADSEKWVAESLARDHPAGSTDARKANRIIVNETKYYAEDYSRMQKRVCSVVTYGGGHNIGNIKYFVMCDNVVYAVMTKMKKIDPSQLPGVPVVSHLTAVEDTETVVLVNVEELCDVLVFIDTRTQKQSMEPCYVCRLPNKYEHAVFK